MQVWIGDDETTAERFGLSLRGLDADALSTPKELLEALHECALFSQAEPWVRSLGRVPSDLAVGHVAGAEGSLLFRRSGERATLDVAAWGDPALAIRSVEAFLLRLDPREARLEPLGAPAGAWRRYPAEGALFVRLVHSEQSEYQRIEIGDHPAYGRLLFLNGETQIADSDERDYSAALVDAGISKHTKRVCILGGGDCGVLREVLSRPGIEAVRMVEIDRAVVSVSERFFPEVVGESTADPRVTIDYADAYEHLRTLSLEIRSGRLEPFDLVIYDLSDDPLELESQDALCARIKAILGPKGRIAVQCGSALPAYAHQLGAHRAGLERHFRRLRFEETLIPSFLEQPWVFASARAPKVDLARTP